MIDRHQALMWEVGDLMGQWEALQTEIVITARSCNHAPARPHGRSTNFLSNLPLLVRPTGAYPSPLHSTRRCTRRRPTAAGPVCA